MGVVSQGKRENFGCCKVQDTLRLHGSIRQTKLAYFPNFAWESGASLQRPWFIFKKPIQYFSNGRFEESCSLLVLQDRLQDRPQDRLMDLQVLYSRPHSRPHSWTDTLVLYVVGSSKPWILWCFSLRKCVR
jgi:hypothetical protein